MAWKVTEGSWKGVDLQLENAWPRRSMARTTFSQDKADQATAVLIVDSAASSRERKALIDMAKTLAGARLSHVASVITAHMSLKLDDHSDSGRELPHAAHGMPRDSSGFFLGGPGVGTGFVTRCLDDRDHACGNETIAYPPLSKAVSAQPAFTLGHAFKGQGLDTRWDDPNCRSSFVGHFAL